MDSKIITLCYRKIIDANVTRPWDRMVFEDSYTEFKIQAQLMAHGTNYTSYGEMLNQLPNTPNLAGMVVPAIIGYIQQLNNIVPDILNNLGRRFLTFKNFRFEIINSNITDQSKHQVAINFFTERLIWHHTVQNFMLVSDAAVPPAIGDEIQIHQFELQPFLSVNTLKIDRS